MAGGSAAMLGARATAVAAAPPGTTTAAPAATEKPDVYVRVTRLMASVAVIAVGFDLHVALGASAALPLAVILFPVWLPVVRTYRMTTLIGVLAALCVAAGLVLAELSSVDHQVDVKGGLYSVGLLASGVAAIALLLWARSLMPLHRVVLLYGAGALADVFLNGELTWKFNFALPTTLVVLALLERRRGGALAAAAVLLMGVFSVIDEGRSLFAAAVLAATLTVWQLRPRAATRRERRWFPVILLGGIGIAVYLFMSALLTGGALGEKLQERTTAQLQAGSLISGGRPEWAATRELIQLNPSGYGLGVAPNWEDRMTGRAGLISIGVDIDDFRDHYMFGGHLELHSVAADLWVDYGWVGVALAATLVVALIRSLSVALAVRRAPTYVVFAGVIALWYMLFGPMRSNWLDVCSAVAFAIAATHGLEASPARQRDQMDPVPLREVTSPW